MNRGGQRAEVGAGSGGGMFAGLTVAEEIFCQTWKRMGKSS